MRHKYFEETWGPYGNIYIPPDSFIYEDNVRFQTGWFFPDVDPEEQAYYIDVDINKNGKVRVIINDHCHEPLVIQE